MLVIVLPDYQALSAQAAAVLTAAIIAKPDMVLGLATGATPRGCYAELVRRHRQEGLDFSRVTTVNLDEYLGLPANHPGSLRSYMERELFFHVNLVPGNILFPDSRIDSGLHGRCAAYEREIARRGGIDLQVLGVGRNGHLGFNEPGSGLDGRTRVVRLSDSTRAANRAGFGGGEVPEGAVTMGLGTIRSARRLLLLADGAGKAEAVAAALEGPVTAAVPASALQLHGDVVVLLDEAAAAGLQRRRHYDDEVDLVRRLTPQRIAGL